VGELVLGQPRSCGDEQERAVRADRAGQGEHQLAALLRRVVDVLDDPERRLLVCQRLHEVADQRVQRVAAERLRVRGRALVLDQRGKRRHEPRRGAEIGPQRFLQAGRPELLQDRGGKTAQSARRGIRAIEDVGVATVEAVQELVDETRLAQPRLAVDEHRAARPLARLLPRVGQQLQLPLPPVDRRLAAHLQRGPVLAQGLLPRRPPGGPFAVVDDAPQLLRRSEALVGMLGQERSHHLREERRHLGVGLRRGARLEAQLRLNAPGRIVAPERVVAGRELVEHDAQRVEVRGRRALLRTELLGSRVQQRADEVAGAGQRHRRLLELGDAQIHDPHVLVVGDEDVLGL
jgi:hypothetical protein